jgi:hypothetical protein
MSKDASIALNYSCFAESEIAQNAALGVEPGQRTLDSFAVDEPRAADALEELAMFFYTSNTPPERANNPHLKRCLALLGIKAPKREDLQVSYLQSARSKVQAATIQSLRGKRYAVVTDGWYKRTAARGAPGG